MILSGRRQTTNEELLTSPTCRESNFFFWLSIHFLWNFPLFATSKVISVRDRKETSGANKREGGRVHQSDCWGVGVSRRPPQIKKREALKHGNLQRSCSMLRTT